MGYVRIASNVPLSPEMLKAGPQASWLWLTCLLYSQRYETDGQIPKNLIPHLGIRGARKLAAKLVEVGLFEDHGAYYVMVQTRSVRWEFGAVIREVKEQFDVWRNKARKRLRALLHLSEGRCVYCGTTDGPFEVDHVIPLSRGGSNDDRNLVAACRPCNRGKRARTAAEFGYPEISGHTHRVQ